MNKRHAGIFYSLSWIRLLTLTSHAVKPRDISGYIHHSLTVAYLPNVTQFNASCGRDFLITVIALSPSRHFSGPPNSHSESEKRNNSVYTIGNTILDSDYKLKL